MFPGEGPVVRRRDDPQSPAKSATDQGRAKYAPDHEPHHESVEQDQENGPTAASLRVTGAIGMAVGVFDVAVMLSVVTFVTLKALTPLKREPPDQNLVGAGTLHSSP